MIKSNFITSLRELLSSLDPIELEKFIIYYDELIEDYKEDGLTEDEIINKIGSAESIALNILQEQNTQAKDYSINKNTYKFKGINLILLILGFPLWGSLFVAGISIVLSLYLVIWCIPFSTGVTSLALIISSFIGLIGSPFVFIESFGIGIVQLGICFASIGATILLALLTFYLSKKLSYLTKASSKSFINLFNKKAVKLW